MFTLIKQLLGLLTSSQRKRLIGLQVMVITSAIAEVIGVSAIAPFMTLVGDISILQGNNILATSYELSGVESPFDFVFWVGILVLIVLTVAAFLSMFTVWKLAMFGAKVGTEIADRLYSYYMRKPWLFHASGSSAQLTKQVAVEAVRVTDGVIQPMMQMNAKIILALFLCITICIYNPLVAFFGIAFFLSAYACLYKFVRNRLHQNGQTLSMVASSRFRLLSEGFGGIKDVLLLNRANDFTDRFAVTGDHFAYAKGNNITLRQVPRYFMELLAFGAMIGLTLYLISYHKGDLGYILPSLSLYAMVGFKLLPAFQQIYSSLGQVKGNIAAFESIRADLKASSEEEEKQNTGMINSTNLVRLKPQKKISLEDVTFTFPGKAKPTLHKLDMDIPVNKVIGIVGPSGAGKSTAIDILIGLITPQKGCLKVDDYIIDDHTRRLWQDIIGFVPQTIFLSEGSIAENVAFGVPSQDIRMNQVEKAIKLAHLEELVVSLENRYDTKVGERGVQLSGGQRQRIGIARALYHDAEILVFDEATSALDGITEKMIMDAIHDFSGQKTIIMIAHRLKTVQKCDKIIFMDKGKVVDQGSYQELIERNDYFKRMATYA